MDNPDVTGPVGDRHDLKGDTPLIIDDVPDLLVSDAMLSGCLTDLNPQTSVPKLSNSLSFGRIGFGHLPVKLPRGHGDGACTHAVQPVPANGP
ncbi:MAG: hypothetical protein ACYDGR_16440 [Candidatus Dormibacteria bacterium]